jgi:hypothetical protein
MTAKPDEVADRLEALAQKLTRGPWVASGLGVEGPRDSASDYDPMVIGGMKGGKGNVHFPSYSLYSVPGRKEGEANAEFLALCRNNLPTILAALKADADRRSLAERIEKLEGALRRCQPVLASLARPTDAQTSLMQIWAQIVEAELSARRALERP